MFLNLPFLQLFQTEDISLWYNIFSHSAAMQTYALKEFAIKWEGHKINTY